MYWLIRNINHFTVPIGMLLGLFAALFGLANKRRLKAGQPPLAPSRNLRVLMVIVILSSCVLLGIALAKDLG